MVFIHVVRPARILLYINVVQSLILRLERGNRVTEPLDCYKIELIQNYHDLISFSVIALIGFRDINVNTDCPNVKVIQPNFYMSLFN